MHTDVNVVDGGSLSEVLLEVLHVSDKEVFFACEVFVNLSIFVENMDHYNFLRFLVILTQGSGCRVLRPVVIESCCMRILLQQRCRLDCLLWFLAVLRGLVR